MYRNIEGDIRQENQITVGSQKATFEQIPIVSDFETSRLSGTVEYIGPGSRESSKVKYCLSQSRKFIYKILFGANDFFVDVPRDCWIQHYLDQSNKHLYKIQYPSLDDDELESQLLNAAIERIAEIERIIKLSKSKVSDVLIQDGATQAHDIKISEGRSLSPLKRTKSWKRKKRPLGVSTPRRFAAFG